MLKGYTVKICEKTFEDEISKQAYLKACKWLAVNVYNSEGYSEYISVKIKKLNRESDDKTYKFRVELFFTVDFESEQAIFCNNCKQSVNTFFGSAAPCSTCRLTPFLKKLKHDTEITVESLKKDFENEKGK